jgi:hypothetical protein
MVIGPAKGFFAKERCSNADTRQKSRKIAG